MVPAFPAESLVPLLLGAAASGATFSGGMVALRLGSRIHIVMALTAGIVLGVAFFDLVPEALDIGGGIYGARALLGALAIGLSIYMIMDRLLAAHGAHGGLRSCLGPASLTLHSFIDGMGIGLAFQVSAAVGAMIALAVLAHDMSDGVNTVGLCLSGNRPGDARGWLAANTMAPLAGVIASRFIAVPAPMLALLLAVFAGMFLYIGACELLPRSYVTRPSPGTTIATLLGMAAMYAVVTLAGG